MQNYKFLNQIVLWNVFFAIICIPTAGKLIDVIGIPLSISIYYFPFVYIFADITTEVYGYAVARRVLWYCIFAQLLTIAVFEFVISYPPSAVMTNNQSHVDVLSAAPRLVLFGTLAMFAGDIANNYVLAKMKVWTNGRYISARFVTSTLCGQMVNTAVFYIFGLWKMNPLSSTRFLRRLPTGTSRRPQTDSTARTCDRLDGNEQGTKHESSKRSRKAANMRGWFLRFDRRPPEPQSKRNAARLTVSTCSWLRFAPDSSHRPRRDIVQPDWW